MFRMLLAIACFALLVGCANPFADRGAAELDQAKSKVGGLLDQIPGQPPPGEKTTGEKALGVSVVLLTILSCLGVAAGAVSLVIGKTSPANGLQLIGASVAMLAAALAVQRYQELLELAALISAGLFVGWEGVVHWPQIKAAFHRAAAPLPQMVSVQIPAPDPAGMAANLMDRIEQGARATASALRP